MILQGLLALGATLGFCLIFNVPRRKIPPAMVIGAAGWLLYKYCAAVLDFSPVQACLLGALLVALLSDIASRVFREAATVFIIPGILPLVPGAGMYYTMRAFLAADYSAMMEVGSETLLMAGSIAIALLLVTSAFRLGMLVRSGISNRLKRKEE